MQDFTFLEGDRLNGTISFGGWLLLSWFVLLLVPKSVLKLGTLIPGNSQKRMSQIWKKIDDGLMNFQEHD